MMFESVVPEHAQKHLIAADVVLTSMDKSRAHTVIMLMRGADYLVLHHGELGQEKKTTTQLKGLARLRIKSLQKLGYNVITVS